MFDSKSQFTFSDLQWQIATPWQRIILWLRRDGWIWVWLGIMALGLGAYFINWAKRGFPVRPQVEEKSVGLRSGEIRDFCAPYHGRELRHCLVGLSGKK